MISGDDHFPGLGQSELATRHVATQLLEGAGRYERAESALSFGGPNESGDLKCNPRPQAVGTQWNERVLRL